MTSIEKVARDLARVEKNLNALATQPRLGHSAIDSGALELKDTYGNTAGYVGQQFDGSVTAAAVGGPPPSSPTIPYVEPVVGGLRMYWDGTYVDGSVTRMDFRRVTFHVVTDTDLFDPVDAAQIMGEVTVATGGEVSVSLPAVEHFICAVVWTDAGKFSVESDWAFATPLPVVDPEMWADHEQKLADNATAQAANEQALATLNDVTLPALDTKLTEAEADIVALNTVATDAATDAAEAVATAAAAKAAADGAIRTFGPEEYPTSPPWADGSPQPPEVVGDLWLDADGVAHRWNGTLWYVIPDELASSALAMAQSSQALAQAAADDVDLLAGRVTTAEGDISSVVTRVQTAEGTISTVQSDITTLEGGVSSHETRLSTAEGDITTVEGRVQTAELDINAVETRMGTAEGNISSVTTIANGKSKVTYSTAAPGSTANAAGDTWFRLSGAEVIGVWKGDGGTAWTAQKYGGAVLDHLDAGSITVGTLAADRIGANTIDSAKIVTAGLDAATIKFGTMSGARIQTGTLTVGQVDGLQGNLEAVESGIAALDSRGTDLIVNGTGVLGDNTGFSMFSYDATDAPVGARGSFVRPTGSYDGVLDGLVAIDPSKEMLFSFQARQQVPGRPAPARMYAFVHPHDSYELPIFPEMHMFQPGTTTTLAAPLNNGDTTITVASTSNWTTTGAYYHRGIIFWDYIDPGGKVWPVESYSRNVQFDLYADGGISGNVITLRTPWAGGSKPVGTKLSNSSAGGTYMYGGAINHEIPDVWTRYTASIKGVKVGAGDASFDSGWPAGAAMAKIGFLLNRSVDNPWNDPGSRHAVAAVSLSDAAAAQAAADSAYTRWAPTGQTTIDGGKITADSITSAQIGADQVTANEIAADTITAAEIAADTITANEMAADSITANELAAGAVVARNVSANAIVAGSLATDAVTSRSIAADQISTEHIQFGAIDGERIGATAIDGKVITGATIRTAEAGRRVQMTTKGIEQFDANEAVIMSIGDQNKFTGSIDATNLLVRDGLELFGKNNYTKSGSEIVLSTGQGGSSTPPGLTTFYEQSPANVANHYEQNRGIFMDANESTVYRGTSFFGWSALWKGNTRWAFPAITRQSDGSSISEFDLQTYTRIKTPAGERAVTIGYVNRPEDGDFAADADVRIYDDSAMTSSNPPTMLPLPVSFQLHDTFSFFRTYALGRLWGQTNWNSQFCLAVMTNDDNGYGGIHVEVHSVSSDTSRTKTVDNNIVYTPAAGERISGVTYGTLGAMKFVPSGHAQAGLAVWVIQTNQRNMVWSTLDYGPAGRLTDYEWPVTPTEQSRAFSFGSLDDGMGFSRFANVDSTSNGTSKITRYSNSSWQGTENPIWAQFAWKGHSSKTSPEYITAPSTMAGPFQRIKRASVRISVPELPSPVGGVGTARDINKDIYSWRYYVGQKSTAPVRTEMRLQSPTPTGEPTTVTSLILPDALATNTANPVLATQGFPAVTPARIISSAGDAGGPHLVLDGNGNIAGAAITGDSFNGQTLADTGWQVPTLASGWTELSGWPVRYRVKNGICYMMGVVVGGQSSYHSVQLPVGARPWYDKRFVVQSSHSSLWSIVNVRASDGVVYTIQNNVGGANQFYHLDPIVFPVD